MSTIVILVVLVLLLVGCRGYDRLTGNPTPPPPSQTVRKQSITVTATITSSNVLELDEVPSKILYAEWMGFYSHKYTEIPPYDESLKNTKKPYYILTEKTLLFFNVSSGSYRVTFDQ